MVKRIIVPGLVAGIAMLVVGLVLSRIYVTAFPALQEEYTNPNLFRSWSDPLMSLYFLHPILVGLVLAWIWDKTKNSFSKNLARSQKAIRFAIVYTVFSACGMLITYSSFIISFTMVASWTISGLIGGIVASLLLARLNSGEQ